MGTAQFPVRREMVSRRRRGHPQAPRRRRQRRPRRLHKVLQEPVPRRASPSPLRPRYHREPPPHRMTGIPENDTPIRKTHPLEPYLKHRQQHIHGVGYIPQPVVRFTGERNQRGTLQPGFLTSFINVSVVQPISTIPEHAALIDAWLSVLSRIGLHSQHITIAGMLSVWRRREVAGITLWFRHGDLTLGDAVLLWNTTDPRFLATDIGSGLERLRWAVASRPWPETVYDRLAAVADTETLDALRTATLVAGSGVRPILGDQVTLCVASCGGSRTA